MIELPPREILATEGRVVIPVGCPAPVTRGSCDVALARTRGGTAPADALTRDVLVTDGAVPAAVFYARDIAAVWPKGGRAWLVVRYAGAVIATGPVTLHTA